MRTMEEEMKLEPVETTTKYRNLGAWPRYLFYLATVLSVALGIFYVFGFSLAGFSFMNWTYYYLLMGLLMPFVFLFFPMFPKKKQSGTKIPWYDVIAAVLACVLPLYFATIAQKIDDMGWSISPSLLLLVLGSIFAILVMESARRTGGNVFAVVALFFAAYPLYAEFVPGAFKGVTFSFPATIGHHIFGAEGILGIPMNVIGELLIGFLLFAGLLIKTGAGDFFLKIAFALAGRFRGGPAKVAVVSSGFFGSLSGSVFANIIGTGSVTIPAMKKAGFSPAFAGSVEACASTGGVLMPPVMGAVAFVMATITDIPYGQICIAAFVPSILYYLALLIQIDCNAARTGIQGLPAVEIPSFWVTMKEGWHFLFVLFFLIGGLLFLKWEAMTPFYASGVLLVLSMFKKNTRIKSRQQVFSLVDGVGRLLVESAGIIVPLGLIISGLTITGMAAAFTASIISLSGGIPFVTLLLGAGACYVLGMVGLLTPAYIFLAVTLAPSLIAVGFNLMAVHLFIMYYAMLSCITPPVAIGSFLAANVAGAHPMKTAWQSMRLGIVIYIVPLFFIYQPTLILQGGTISEFLFHFSTCIIGIFILSCGIEGYVYGIGNIGFVQRTMIFTGGLLVAAPNATITGIGFVVSVLIYLFMFYKKRAAVRDNIPQHQ
jgi:TRAP transporter 4TM/12TM fusion protein